MATLSYEMSVIGFSRAARLRRSVRSSLLNVKPCGIALVIISRTETKRRHVSSYSYNHGPLNSSQFSSTSTLTSKIPLCSSSTSFGKLTRAITTQVRGQRIPVNVNPVKDNYFLDRPEAPDEVERLEIQNRIWKLLLNDQLSISPLHKKAKVLDVGCGSGIWATEVAKQYPEAQVIGIDLTPPKPDSFSSPVPANLQFLQADATAPWEAFTQRVGSDFDLVTMRVLVAGISDWPALFSRCAEHVRPGGWIEVPDATAGIFSGVAADDIKEDNRVGYREEAARPVMRWWGCYRRAIATAGIDGWANEKHAARLADAGFVNVSERFFRAYLHEDAVDGLNDEKTRQLARLMLRDYLSLIGSITKAMVDRAQWEVMGIDRPGLERLMEEAKEDMIENGLSRRYYVPL